jgi:hypothetical protein
MATPTLDLWTLARKGGPIDAGDLANAVAEQIKDGELDYRTRWLVRDSVDVRRHDWGTEGLEAWLARATNSGRI